MTTGLSSATNPDRHRSVSFDFPELKVGIAEYESGPTGCTVLHLNDFAQCVADVRGGSPGAIGTQYGYANAICFAGGSLYGLEAISGVASALLQERGSVNWTSIDLVAGAIIWDFSGRETIVYPDRDLGIAALRAAQTGVCPVGQQGAGRSATAGKYGGEFGLQSEPAGQGAAFCELGDTGVKLFMLTVVNAMGVVLDRNGEIVRGCLDPVTGQRHHPRDIAARSYHAPSPQQPENRPTQNTTISALITNRTMSHDALTQLGRQVHSSMFRAIHPFHAPWDGDVLFTLSTGTQPETAISDFALTEAAVDLAWDAVLSAVGEA